MNVGNYSEALEQQVRLFKLANAQRFSSTEAVWRAKIADIDFDSSQCAATEVITTSVLERAATFYWDADMCPLLTSAAKTLRDWRLSESDLPTPAGFIWLAQGEQVIGAGIHHRRVRAFAWAKVGDDQITAIDFVQGARNVLFPGTWAKWRFADRLMDAARTFTGDEEDIAHATSLLRYVAASYGLLAQRIVTARHTQAERHARKRLERDGWEQEPLIRVVELRRREQVGHKGTVASVETDWQCQWVVRGH